MSHCGAPKERNRGARVGQTPWERRQSLPANFRQWPTDRIEQARIGGAPRKFALIPSARSFWKTRQTASLPYLFGGEQVL